MCISVLGAPPFNDNSCIIHSATLLINIWNAMRPCPRSDCKRWVCHPNTIVSLQMKPFGFMRCATIGLQYITWQVAYRVLPFNYVRLLSWGMHHGVLGKARTRMTSTRGFPKPCPRANYKSTGFQRCNTSEALGGRHDKAVTGRVWPDFHAADTQGI